MGAWWSRVLISSGPSSGHLDLGDREEQRGLVIEYFQNLTLDEHLQDPHGWNAFHEFLESEYCGENTRFWLAVQQLRTSVNKDSSEIEAMVKAIGEAHFGGSAPYEVNLPINLMRLFKNQVDAGQYSVDMLDEAQEVICSMLVNSHWRRYPNSPFFNRWLDTKLTDTAFVKTLTGSKSVDPISLEDIDIQIQSVIRVKTLEEFLQDPLAFACFKDFLGTSKLSLEYTDLLLFWTDVEEFVSNPSAELAKRIFSTYIKKDTEGVAPIVLPMPIYEPIAKKIESGAFEKSMFTAAHLHARSKLKKDAFGPDFFESSECKKYVAGLVDSEVAFQEDAAAGFPKLHALFSQGKPGKSNTISRSGLEKVLSTIIADQYGIQFKNKATYSAYCSQYLSASAFLSFDEFTNLFHKLLMDPNIPFYNTKYLE